MTTGGTFRFRRVRWYRGHSFQGCPLERAHPTVDAQCVGWRDREWAKLDDDELRALYGVEGAVASGRTGHARAVVWGAVAVLALAVAGFGATLLPHSHGASAQQAKPAAARS
jgi:hypothetical protein